MQTKTIFLTEFVGMFVIYLHTKFLVSSSGGLLVIIIKLKAKYRFHAANILFHCLLKIIYKRQDLDEPSDYKVLKKDSTL